MILYIYIYNDHNSVFVSSRCVGNKHVILLFYKLTQNSEMFTRPLYYVLSCTIFKTDLIRNYAFREK